MTLDSIAEHRAQRVKGDGVMLCAVHWTTVQTWERSTDPVLRILGLPVASHDVALLCANHELGWACLRVVLQAAAGMMQFQVQPPH